MDPILAIAASGSGARLQRHLRHHPELIDTIAWPPGHLRRAEAIAADSRALGHHLLSWSDPEYPRALAALRDAPWVLYLKGDRRLLAHPAAVAVVGSRRGTLRGRWLAEALGRDLARAGVCVVSGLALGVDALAHRGALSVQGSCLGVVATGLDRCHPRAHRQLHEDVARAGLLVSEYPPGTPPRKHAFVARNRILASLARGVVVVEASASSGALSTVDFALQMGREVLCCPAPPDCECAQGSLQLLREGATLVRHAGDVLESLALEPGPRGAMGEGDAGSLGLGTRPESVEEIARRLGRRLPEVMVQLEELLDQGRVRRVAGGRWQMTS